MTMTSCAIGKYRSFLSAKSQIGMNDGFEPLWLPDFLFNFQRTLVEWAVRRGRAALFEDCGLGKSIQELVWAENVIRHTNKPVLLLTPLSVGGQMLREATRFGIDAVRSADGSFAGKRVVIANYERLHYFNSSDFSGVVCDESSILKNFDGKRKAAITEFVRTIPYRLLCTATAAPNDYIELGTSSEALGELGYQDMITRFFKQETQKDHLGWGRTKYRMRGHAENDFWRWVCSWARAVRKPSDMGFDDAEFLLPDLVTEEHVVEARVKRSGHLFDVAAVSLQEQQEEGRRTLPERCEKAAELINHTGKPAVAWCHLNTEGDMLEKLLPGSVQVSGSDSDEAKEEAFEAFSEGKIRVLVTKPKMAGFGLNWQHCSHQTFFPSHSFEQFYQAIRRCWRFGQTNLVKVDVVASEGQFGILANLQRKSAAAEVMFGKLVELMNDQLRIKHEDPYTQKGNVPSWLSSIKS